MKQQLAIWWPDAGDPLVVFFVAEARGIATISMDGAHALVPADAVFRLDQIPDFQPCRLMDDWGTA